MSKTRLHVYHTIIIYSRRVCTTPPYYVKYIAWATAQAGPVLATPMGLLLYGTYKIK